MNDAPFQHQSSPCAERWLTHKYPIIHHWVRSDKLCPITELGIAVSGVIADAITLPMSSHCEDCELTQYFCIGHYILGVMPEELLLHQSPMSADWWLMHDSCFSHHSVRSDAWRNITSKVTKLCGELTWWIIITSVITIWGEITDARLLPQSSLCADWRLTHYYYAISHHC